MASRRQIWVKGVPIGGGAPVAVQSMTKTETADYDATMRQIRAIADAGADLVRVAVPRDDDVEALKRIVVESPIPVIADIHFNYTLALKAIDAGADCIRLNPGNIGGPDKVAQVADRARAAGTPMRCKELVTAMADRGLWTSTAPTPHQTLASALLREITKKGAGSRFRKADRGTFELNPA